MAKKKNRRSAASTEVVRNFHARDRWFTTAKVLLAIAPFISLGYLQAAAGTTDLQSVLSQNPTLTVSFLASMTGPFIAYLLKFVQQHLHAGDAGYAVCNLTLMMVAEAMLSNTIYFILMIVLLYFVFEMTGVSPAAAIRQKWNDHFWRDISGSIVLLVFSAFCIFVSFRLGMY